jgi:LmbE family N-acetylglucosaminyl deacetylase
VKFDAAELGTTSDSWTASGRLESIPELDWANITQVAVVSAHPDDETLGAGGLIAEARLREVPVTVIVVTDGSSSNPESTVRPHEIATVRSRELRAAIAVLAESATVVELGFADGRTDEFRAQIAAGLASSVPPTATVVAPWRGDGHHDHRIVGEICAALARENGVALLEYPVWMWHWADPDDPDIPLTQMRSLALSADAGRAKRDALTRYESQTTGLGDGPGDAPVLSPTFLEHFERETEYFVVTNLPDKKSKTEAYFDGLYERNPDPWRLSTRWYETRKRALSMAVLPRARYRSALEIGCSVGELTALLADRSDSLLALDISQAAVNAANERTRDLAHVRIEHRDATTDFPEQQFDLIVLSEVGYYWEARTLDAMVREISRHLSQDGVVLACHWRHPVADYPLTGDQVHAALNASPDLHRLARHVEEDFVLELFGTSSVSVARSEGLLG